MKRVFIACCICFFASGLWAENSGSWSSQGGGLTLTQGEEQRASGPLTLDHTAATNAHITHYQWHIRLLNGAPRELKVKLCHLNQCVTLPTLSGRASGLTSLPAQGAYTFVYWVDKLGQLSPGVTIVSNSLSIDYT